MRVQLPPAVINNCRIVNNDRSDDLSSYRYEQIVGERTSKLPPGIIIMDLFEDENGFLKSRAITFLNTERNIDLNHRLDEII